MADDVRCAFYVRTTVSDDPAYLYESMDVPTGYRGFITPHPPMTGDLVHLAGGTYRVVERAWHYPEFGSRYWPSSSARPERGPNLDVILESASGPFLDDIEAQPAVRAHD